jgi:hypothetical protein
MRMTHLKMLMRFAFIYMVSVTLYSCCKTIDCDTGRINEITAVNFPRQDLSNFSIKKFNKNSNFTLAIDSMILSQGADYKLVPISTDTTNILFDKLVLRFPIEAGYDYEFFFPNGNTLRRLTEITESKTSEKFCNTGFAKNICYNNISSLKIDGVAQASLLIRR